MEELLKEESQDVVTLKNINLRYNGERGEVTALQNVNLNIEKGEFICVLGPSGCGKSTLLNIIAGFLKPTEGEARMNGEIIDGASWERAVVCQTPTLYPWLNIHDNVAFGPNVRHLPKEQTEELTKKYLNLVELGEFGDHKPYELSGGMRQRAGLARTLAMNPKVILMDEPFSAVDHVTKCTLQEELINIRQAENKTVLFVTHDINEAVFLADRVVLLSPRPSTIQKIYEIPLEQKRGRNDPLLLKIAAEIAKDINSGGQDIPNNYWGNL